MLRTGTPVLGYFDSEVPGRYSQNQLDQLTVMLSIDDTFIALALEARCALTHIGQMSHLRRRNPAGFLIELQLEASVAAFHGDEAQQRCELQLVLRGNAGSGQERGPAAARPRSFTVELYRSLESMQGDADCGSFSLETQLIVAQRGHRR